MLELSTKDSRLRLLSRGTMEVSAQATPTAHVEARLEGPDRPTAFEGEVPAGLAIARRMLI